MRRAALGCGAGVLFLTLSLPAQNADGVAYFEKNIRPLLAKNCYGCHSAQAAQPMAGLLLDSRAGMLRGGKSGLPALLAGKPDDSLMIAAVRRTGDLKMPPGKALQPEEVEALVEWIRMGAPDPRTEGTAPSAPAASYDWEKARQHWSFQPVRDPEPPRVSPADWNRSAIDRFVKAKLDENKLTPQPRASKLALIRRATYDLTGLPPTPEEVDAFLKDSSPKAFEKVVDRLLASPRYGERWGRHWLDVVRYADTSGDNADFPVPAMYRYRNWVIAAFNTDEPYDQFLRDQIAGDLIAARENVAEKNREEWQAKIIATSYLANARRFGSRKAEFHLTIDDVIDNVGKGMLGLTVACARCHNHKFDPIPTADYYALYGIFKSTNFAHAGTEIYPHTYGFAALKPEDAEKLKSYEAELSGLDNRIEDIKAGRIKFDTPDERRKAERENQQKVRQLSAEYPYLPKAYAVSDGTPADARIMVRGEPQTLGPAVPRGFLTILGGQKLPPEEKGSGRLELADWIGDAKNPLTARVMANRIWEWHFGQGIVATPDDFGARGERPSNPELLDYLASRFIAGGWSVKKMHRLIMLSRTYQMASGDDPKNALKDAKNAYQWKFNRRRLDAEEIRDSLLAVSSKLDLIPAGEQPFPPEMQWKYTQHTPFIGAEAQYTTNKRSVYLMQQRIRRQPFLDLFDGADTNAETGVRPVTTTALQALYTMNDPFFHAQAEALAGRVTAASPREPERLEYAYKLVYGRKPAADESKLVRQFLVQEQASTEETPAWASLMRVLLASNEFLTLD
ncbi:MAG TPA: PSD1 and planctomycete cytochrome C domain-containing protein [Bryobacteraceae bacterium]|jgi:hypothetical protein